MRAIKTHSIELQTGHVLVGIAPGHFYPYMVRRSNGFIKFSDLEMKEKYNFNPSDHDLTKLGTEVIE